FSSIAAVGFALTAYPIGVERGWIERDEARARTLATLEFFWTAPQGPAPSGVTGYRGFFYHFLDMETGTRFETTELSTIDTTLLLGGVLLAAVYFDGSTAGEARIRALADSLYERVDWAWARAEGRAPYVAMGWKPGQGFGPADWEGYNEAMLLYVLALASPTHPVEPDAWDAWTSTYRWAEFQGQPHVNFAPLFGHHYSHVWIDFRGIQDEYMRGRGIDYFENSRRATLAQRAYAIENPMAWKEYGEDVWGLTASDGPIDRTLEVDGVLRQFHTYWARGAAAGDIRDDGTIAPTAAGGSIPFAAEVTIPALMAMRARYGDDVYNVYGFLDAFNPTFSFEYIPLRHGHVVPGKGWFDDDQLGIDQGPILIMAENHRTGLVWDLMKGSPPIVRGLCRAGFAGGWLEGRCE
ncbi:MAG: glucoamylase family protein, partial [Gemmatimonadota bacterium]